MKKLVAIMNKSVEPGRVMNALSHISISLGAQIGKNKLEAVDYVDQDGNIYPDISKMPFIILKANSNKIKNMVRIAKEQEITFSAFTDTMTVGTWQEQLDKTSQTEQQNLEFWGVVMYGDADKLSEHTKKFSLWK